MLTRQEASSARRGATPVWLVCALLALAAGWLVSNLEQAAAAQGFTELDPARVAIELPAGTDGIPPGWSEIVALHLARLGELSTLDEDLIESVVAEVEALPFVLEVGQASVVWPDGLNVKIRLREPVACICVGQDYLPVASDGMVLPGHRQGPPDFGRGILPVIGPVQGDFLDFRPGDVLIQERHLDALSVAVSMREHLSPGDIDALGPVVIDARNARRCAVDEPGTRLWLEADRTVFFGRPPSHAEPGELPERTKWSHLMEAVGSLKRNADPGQVAHEREWSDWDLVDVRWDLPTLRPRIGFR